MTVGVGVAVGVMVGVGVSAGVPVGVSVLVGVEVAVGVGVTVGVFVGVPVGVDEGIAIGSGGKAEAGKMRNSIASNTTPRTRKMPPNLLFCIKGNYLSMIEDAVPMGPSVY